VCIHIILNQQKKMVGGTKKVHYEKSACSSLIICNKEENTQEIVETKQICQFGSLIYLRLRILPDDIWLWTNFKLQNGSPKWNNKLAFALSDFKISWRYSCEDRCLFYLENPYMVAGSDNFIKNYWSWIILKHLR
jgi:hypothetical protein